MKGGDQKLRGWLMGMLGRNTSVRTRGARRGLRQSVICLTFSKQIDAHDGISSASH